MEADVGPKNWSLYNIVSLYDDKGPLSFETIHPKVQECVSLRYIHKYVDDKESNGRRYESSSTHKVRNLQKDGSCFHETVCKNGQTDSQSYGA